MAPAGEHQGLPQPTALIATWCMAVLYQHSRFFIAVALLAVGVLPASALCYPSSPVMGRGLKARASFKTQVIQQGKWRNVECL